MKNLTPAKMILLVVLAFGGMIGLFVGNGLWPWSLRQRRL